MNAGSKTSPFVVITADSKLGGAQYFLLRKYKDWMIVTSPLEVSDDDLFLHPLAKVENGIPFTPEPTIMWVKDNKVIQVYVPSVDYAQFARENDLDIWIGDGLGLATSKRISRASRPMFVEALVPHLTMLELELDEPGMKAIDGAGVVHRHVLTDMVEHLPAGISQQKRRSLIAKLKHITRVEFTIIDAKGQRKGHAIVSDKIDTDFVIPKDIKGDFKLLTATYISFNLSVKGKNSLLLDRQSLLDLAHFYNPENLAEWMRLEADFFAQGVRNGWMAQLMGRIDADDSLDSVLNWHVMKFAAKGGNFMWSKKLVRDVFGQHINKIQSKYQDKLRFPVPGGSAYVMTDAVARLAGLDIVVQRGHVRIDLARATVWVNAQDWVEYLAAVWGGADSDDRLNIQQCTDTSDGIKKVLLWRSPNMQGEYVLLLPDEHCDTLEWDTAAGPISYVKMDCSLLPTRIDQRNFQYTGTMEEKVKLPAVPYSVKAMMRAIERAVANAGTLGMYCNMLMLLVAVYGELPETLHLPLEYIIDATVKDGRDVSTAKEWCYFMAGKMLSEGVRIPHLVADKFAGLIGQDKTFQLTSDHWLDKLERVLNDHIKYAEALRDGLMAQCVMPPEVMAHAVTMTGAAYGNGFIQTYNTATHDVIRAQSGRLNADGYEIIRQRSESYLKLAGETPLTEVMIGALHAANVSDHNDSACWQMEGEGDREGGIADLTMQALTEIGLLFEITEDVTGTVVYPLATIRETEQVAIRITAVWWRLLKAVDKDLPAEITMGDATKRYPEKAQQAKSTVQQWAASGQLNKTYRVEDFDNRKVLVTERGNIFGFVAKGCEDCVCENVTILNAFATDGDLTATIVA